MGNHWLFLKAAYYHSATTVFLYCQKWSNGLPVGVSVPKSLRNLAGYLTQKIRKKEVDRYLGAEMAKEGTFNKIEAVNIGEEDCKKGPAMIKISLVRLQKGLVYRHIFGSASVSQKKIVAMLPGVM